MKQYWLPKERVRCVQHGWSGRTIQNLEALHKAGCNQGSNVLAISGPAGTGKSFIISLLLEKGDGKYEFANKYSLRKPKELERMGKIPYNHISLRDVIDATEPLICCTNVGLGAEIHPEWLWWMEKLNLAKRGVIIPEPNEIGEVAEEFMNCYRLKDILEQQSRAEENGRVLVFEISYNLEEDLAKIFPNMKVVRLFARKTTIADRIIARQKPKSRRDWVVASMKILESVSSPPWVKKSTEICISERNQTIYDSYEIMQLVEHVFS